MEKFVQQIKDRTEECFDDHFSCRKQNWNRQHVCLELAEIIHILYLQMDKVFDKELKRGIMRLDTVVVDCWPPPRTNMGEYEITLLEDRMILDKNTKE